MNNKCYILINVGNCYLYLFRCTHCTQFYENSPMDTFQVAYFNIAPVNKWRLGKTNWVTNTSLI